VAGRVGRKPASYPLLSKNGFVEFDKHIFILGDDEQTDIMMKIPLAGTHSA
jgi:hypothetical protein